MLDPPPVHEGTEVIGEEDDISSEDGDDVITGQLQHHTLQGVTRYRAEPLTRLATLACREL